jgi:hypothetical protein
MLRCIAGPAVVMERTDELRAMIVHLSKIEGRRLLSITSDAVHQQEHETSVNV